jgi:hypothetical protein
MNQGQPFHSDDDEDAWMKNTNPLDPFGDDIFFDDDPFNDLSLLPKSIQPNQSQHFPVDEIAHKMAQNQSIGSMSTPNLFGRRTLSSPMITLTPPPQQPYSPQISFQLPGVQTSINLTQSKISRFLAPVDTQARAQEDAEFMAATHDTSLIVSPHALGFIPFTLWHDRNYTFGELVSDFFQRKNHASCRFSYKLFNSLRLSEITERFAVLCGVKWLNNIIVRVDKRAFARLLGIKSIDGSLFHQQGNFTSHGFIEVSAEDVPRICPDVDLTGVDYDAVRLLYHSDGTFVRTAQEADLITCKWASGRK